MLHFWSIFKFLHLTEKFSTRPLTNSLILRSVTILTLCCSILLYFVKYLEQYYSSDTLYTFVQFPNFLIRQKTFQESFGNSLILKTWGSQLGNYPKMVSRTTGIQQGHPWVGPICTSSHLCTMLTCFSIRADLLNFYNRWSGTQKICF